MTSKGGDRSTEPFDPSSLFLPRSPDRSVARSLVSLQESRFSACGAEAQHFPLQLGIREMARIKKTSQGVAESWMRAMEEDASLNIWQQKKYIHQAIQDHKRDDWLEAANAGLCRRRVPQNDRESYATLSSKDWPLRWR